MKKLFIRVDASNQIGYGHLTRCMSIANYFRDRLFECFFILKASDQAVANTLVYEKSYACIILNEEKDIFKLLDEHNPHILVLDINNKILFETKEAYSTYTSSLALYSNVITVSFEEYEEDQYTTNMAIIPYVGAEDLFINFPVLSNYLLGEKFFIFRDEFLRSDKVAIRKNAHGLFMCMGGSDPNLLSEKCITFLIEGGVQLDLTIVFSKIEDARRLNLENILKGYLGKVNILINPDNIASVITSSDIGIINSGLIKYETSFLGLPCISISNNNDHEHAMYSFSQRSGIIHLGVFDDQLFAIFNSQLKLVIEDYSLRKEMSVKCLKLFDGLGLSRIYDRSINLLNKQR